MADEWYKTVYQNKHEDINDFLQYKQSVGRSPRTTNAYSRILKKFYHEQFPEITPATTVSVAISHLTVEFSFQQVLLLPVKIDQAASENERTQPSNYLSPFLKPAEKLSNRHIDTRSVQYEEFSLLRS